jgi:hypothetical protein
MSTKTKEVIVNLILFIFVLSMIASTVALLTIAVDLHAWVHGTAWNAPWVNVIERGPVQ